MPVYLIIEIRVRDAALYAGYVEKVPAIIRKYGGRYLVRGGEVTPYFGGWNPERMVLVEFESREQLDKCFSSPEYLELAPLREKSTDSRSIIAEGLRSG